MHRHTLVHDVASAELQNKFLDAIKSMSFFQCTNTASNDGQPVINDEVYDVGQGVSLLNRSWEPEIRELLNRLTEYIPNNYQIQRVKVNHMVQASDAGNRWNIPHRDHAKDGVWAIVYYINDADGDTVLFYENAPVRVSPKQGSALVLPANQLHASSCPVVSKDRYVLNIVVSGGE